MSVDMTPFSKRASFLSTVKNRACFVTDNPRLAVKRQTFEDGKPAKTTLVGYPILWGELSSDRGGYKVRLVENSATFTTPAMALFGHDFNSVLGNTANNTLRIGAADDTGIPVEIDLPDTTLGKDMATLVGDGFISGMSFSMMNGFEDYAEEKQGDQYILNVTKFTVNEVTITPIPAFSATSIAVKADAKSDESEIVPAPQATLPTPGGMSRVGNARRILRAWRLHSLTR